MATDRFVLANFNSGHKIDAEVFSVWMSLLRACHKCELWLLQVSEPPPPFSHVPLSAPPPFSYVPSSSPVCPAPIAWLPKNLVLNTAWVFLWGFSLCLPATSFLRPATDASLRCQCGSVEPPDTLRA